MAIKTVLVDDFDGTPLALGASSTTFSINGVAYEIDLTPDNLEQPRTAPAPRTAAARRPGPAPAKAPKAAKGSDPARLNAIREWARANGHSVAERGRIAGSIIEAFDAAH